MPSLSSYPNVENTCLVILQQKGFRLWTDAARNHWFAERDGWDFMADSPIELLGLVAVFEFHRPTEPREYWWRLDQPTLIDSLPMNPPDSRPVDATGAA